LRLLADLFLLGRAVGDLDLHGSTRALKPKMSLVLQCPAAARDTGVVVVVVVVVVERDDCLTPFR